MEQQTLFKCKSTFILVTGECLCNTLFLKNMGIWNDRFKLQLHTATIHATFCSLVEQDETPLA